MNNREDFEALLALGRKGEDAVARYILRKLGFIITPVSKIEEGIGKGPRLYLPNGRTVAVPDLFCIKPVAGDFVPFDLPPVFTGIPFCWIDVKLKNKCSFYRKNQRWQTGIDRRCWLNYREVKRMTGIDTWVFHLILPTPEVVARAQGAKGWNMPAPTGLYGHPVSLQWSDSYGTMVYWGIEDLVKFAELDDIPLEDLLKEAA